MQLFSSVSSIASAAGLVTSTALGVGGMTVATTHKKIQEVVIVSYPTTPQSIKELRCVPRNYKMGYENSNDEDGSPKLTYECFFVTHKYQYYDLNGDGSIAGDYLE